ncbi:hypothetical protein AK830_g1292 [Neonectria ditissima]|uniref:Aminoglycoside phosphotransferase domain-containing protein n=1 Tax=Neonectria ditissima TaxID=78410 RepID=A0A0P7B6D2_9HYPO|nr:hypothetical protein AK830_g1292 [Neonectria ditissima]
MSGNAQRPEKGHVSLDIHNTPFRRLLTRLALKTTARLFHRQGACVPISKHLIVKSDSFVDLTEAATIEYVAKNTSIPVPKIWSSFVRDGRAYIVMERIHGDSISQGWNERSKESKEKLIFQLKLMLQDLRTIQPPPGTGVASCVGGSLFDSRLPRPDRRFGPFETIQDFHLWLRGNVRPLQMEKPEQATQGDWNDAKNMAAKQDGPWPASVFSHGDLNPSNIIVRGDQIVGIIDWEFSGWYPHYWEYTSAWCSQKMRKEWQDLLGDFLEPFSEELEMEKIRQRWWGEV